MFPFSSTRTWFSISFKEGGESVEIDDEGADISFFICMV